MDILLGKVTQQAMNYAIRYYRVGNKICRECADGCRSGITITAGYAIRQSSRLLKVYLLTASKAVRMLIYT